MKHEGVVPLSRRELGRLLAGALGVLAGSRLSAGVAKRKKRRKDKPRTNRPARLTGMMAVVRPSMARRARSSLASTTIAGPMGCRRWGTTPNSARRPKPMPRIWGLATTSPMTVRTG